MFFATLWLLSKFMQAITMGKKKSEKIGKTTFMVKFKKIRLLREIFWNFILGFIFLNWKIFNSNYVQLLLKVFFEINI